MVIAGVPSYLTLTTGANIDARQRLQYGPRSMALMASDALARLTPAGQLLLVNELSVPATFGRIRRVSPVEAQVSVDDLYQHPIRPSA